MPLPGSSSAGNTRKTQQRCPWYRYPFWHLPCRRQDRLKFWQNSPGSARGLALSQQVGIFGQGNRQIRLRHRNHPARGAVNHRNGGAPVPLTGNPPVTQTERDARLPMRASASPPFSQWLPCCPCVKLSGIGHNASGRYRPRSWLRRQGSLLPAAPPPGLFKSYFLAKSKSRWSPEGTDIMAPVPYPIKIGRIDRDLFTGGRIDTIGAGEHLLFVFSNAFGRTAPAWTPSQ